MREAWRAWGRKKERNEGRNQGREEGKEGKKEENQWMKYDEEIYEKRIKHNIPLILLRNPRLEPIF